MEQCKVIYIVVLPKKKKKVIYIGKRVDRKHIPDRFKYIYILYVERENS